MRIVLENWGPVKKFEYDFSKSMIITYGDNNIGKSFAMQVVYLLLKHLILFSQRSFGRFGYYYLFEQKMEESPENQMVIEFSKDEETEVEDISHKLESFCAERMAQTLFPLLTDSFRNTFGTYDKMLKDSPKITLEIDNMMKCVFDIANEKISLEMCRKPTRLRKSLSEFHKSRNGKDQLDIYVYQNHVSAPIQLVFEQINNMQQEFAVAILKKVRSVYFLPASRSGIYTGMGSFGPIMAQLSQNRAYIRGTIQIPSISEPISDYYMMLSEIHGDVQGHYSEYAKEIENSVLNGEVVYDKKSKSIMYRPFESDFELGMNDTSSMVSEISPVTAFLKYIIEKNVRPQIKRAIGYEDRSKTVIFIEEPEAHLHPGKQVALIKAFVKLLEENVILVMASHSNYIFNQLNNLVLDKKINSDNYSPIILKMDGQKSTSEFMPMDDLGVDDENFMDISQQLMDERDEIIDRLINEQ